MTDNNKVTNKANIKLGDIADILSEEYGCDTLINYVPYRNTIVLKAIIKVPALHATRCNTIGDLINIANKQFDFDKEPPLTFKIVAISKELKDNQNINLLDTVDIINPAMMSPKPFIKGSANITKILADIKAENKGLHAAANHADSEKRSKVITIDSFKNVKADKYNPNDILEFTAYYVTEFHNIAGVYINPETID